MNYLQTQEDLKQAMQQEVDMMREILANLIEEENVLLLEDKLSWIHLMQERFCMIRQVKGFRENRNKATDELLILAKESSLKKILEREEDLLLSIPLLLDQLMLLTDKINTQLKRNQVFSEMPQHLIAISNSMRYPRPSKALVSGKPERRFLMTLPEET